MKTFIITEYKIHDAMQQQKKKKKFLPSFNFDINRINTIQALTYILQ